MGSFQTNLFLNYATETRNNTLGTTSFSTTTPKSQKIHSKFNNNQPSASSVNNTSFSFIINNHFSELVNSPPLSRKRISPIKNFITKTPIKDKSKVFEEFSENTSSDSDSESINIIKRIKRVKDLSPLNNSSSDEDDSFSISFSGINNFSMDEESDKENVSPICLITPPSNHSTNTTLPSPFTPFSPAPISNFLAFGESPTSPKTRSFTSSPTLPPSIPKKKLVARHPNVYVITERGLVEAYRGTSEQKGLTVDLNSTLKQELGTITLRNRTIRHQVTPLGRGQFNKVYEFREGEVLFLDESEVPFPLNNAVCKIADTSIYSGDPEKTNKKNIESAYFDRISYDKLASFNVPLPHRYVAPSPENSRFWGIYQKIQHSVPNDFILNWQGTETTINSVSLIERKILEFGKHWLTAMATHAEGKPERQLCVNPDPQIIDVFHIDDFEPKNVMFDLVDDGEVLPVEIVDPDQIIEEQIIDGRTVIMRKKFVPYVTDFSHEITSGHNCETLILMLKFYVWAWCGRQKSGDPKSPHLFNWLIQDFPESIKTKMSIFE